MPFPPNYRQQRANKSRAKDEKKQEKLRRREEASSRRKALRESQDGAASGDNTPHEDHPAEPVRE
jgi:hypothetical protein